MPNDTARPAGDQSPEYHHPTDADVDAIAAELIREADLPPASGPALEISASAHELAPADEERVEDAIVRLGYADPEDTGRAQRAHHPKADDAP